MHLTNFSLNKYNTNSKLRHCNDNLCLENQNTVLRTITWFHQIFCAANNLNFDKIWFEIENLIYKSVLASLDDLIQGYQSRMSSDVLDSINSQSSINQKLPHCFEILGYDIMLDANFKPWILEINHGSDLSDDTAIQKLINTKLIYDTVDLVGSLYNLNWPHKKIKVKYKSKIYDPTADLAATLDQKVENYCYSQNLYKKLNLQKFEFSSDKIY